MEVAQPKTSVPSAPQGRARRRYRNATTAYLFILPGMALFVAWTLYPLLYSFVMSFAEWNLIKPSRFVGLENYRRALSDPVFWLALRNTLSYTLITVPGQMILGLGLALLLDQPLRGRAFFRTMYYIPVVTSWVVVSLIFTYLYNGQAGLINWLLRDALHLIDANINWLGEPLTANIAIATLGIWKGIGWTMVIFLAGLQSIPQEVYEAAAIDGASSWQRLRSITLPLIRQTTLFILVLLTIGGFQVFISVYVMTGGKPLHRTDVLLTYMYSNAFEFLDLGYGSALSYLFALMVFALSMAQIRLLRRPVDY
ncbi:MAG TPA: sugar ABC transporter permease [Kouleothrix sp.]|uniref:carbohydrate ABC transporter permease n=1 Tax=Kouleothrix sp. TaxID=2779161 RepID=UPI002D10D7AB|nr:sugar ABC transporter permease [Kouleothrix sp.]